MDTKGLSTVELSCVIESIGDMSSEADVFDSIFVADGTGNISLDDVFTVADDDFDIGDDDEGFARSTMILRAPIAVRNFAKLSGLTLGLD